MQNSFTYEMSSGTANITKSEKYCKKYWSVVSLQVTISTSKLSSSLKSVFQSSPKTPQMTRDVKMQRFIVLSVLSVKFLFIKSTEIFTRRSTKRGTNAEKYKNKFLKNFIYNILPKLLKFISKTITFLSKNDWKFFHCCLIKLHLIVWPTKKIIIYLQYT